MSSKSTWISVFVAAGLFAFIFFFERQWHRPPSGPARILPALQAAAVTSIQVRPGSQREIRAHRTNDMWQLTEPIVYPAQAASIESLLAELERLVPADYITSRELRYRPEAEAEYGFDAPQASIILQQGGHRDHIYIGARTAPGDQVFLQVVGGEGVYVVDADLLKFIPRSADEWRDTTFVNLKPLAFDRLTVTNGTKTLELQRDATNQLWRMVRPLQTRANNEHIEASLLKLQSLSVNQFVPQEPKPDPEALGLQPGALEIAISRGTNTLLLLQFGKSPPNQTNTVFARRTDQPTIVTVQKSLLAPWLGDVNDFRDPHLLTLSAPADVLEVHGEDRFTLQRQASNTWRVLPQPSPSSTESGQSKAIESGRAGFPADPALVQELLDTLSGMRITQFVKDVVTDPALPEYSLASPARKFVLRLAVTNSTGATTNGVVAQIDFGVKGEKVYARRADEDSVYEVRPEDFQRLPSASWHVRDRRIWNFTENDIASVTIQQAGQTRTLIRKGENSWSLAPGSQGVINDGGVEEAAHGFGSLTAAIWVAPNLQLTFELKSGEKLNVQFGKEAPSRFPYAAVKLAGETWICEFPWPLYQYTLLYLALPPNGP
jgi:hypothetical protein